MANIKGNFKRYIFKSNNGFVVGLFKVKESDNVISYIDKTITFTGYFNDLNENDYYSFNGELIEHERYGEQFNVLSYEIIPPTDKDALVVFLSSDIFKGIGEKKAKKIVDMFGKDTIDIILNNPSNLLLVPTITNKQKDIIYNSLLDYQSSYKTIVSLNDLGFNTKDSITIFNKYKENTMNMIEEDVYQLVDDIYEINFKKIDSLRKKFNINDNDERRIKATIKYVINEVNNSIGDTYILKKDIFRLVNRVTYINDYDLISDALLKLINSNEIINIAEKYYLSNMYETENYIANKLVKLSTLSDNNKKLDNVFNSIEDMFNLEFNPEQERAIKMSLKDYFMIITGGPGVGKTTIIKAICELYKELYKLSMNDLLKDIALLAPTGRASKRISEQTNLPSYTIHRFLKWNKEDNSFQLNEKNKSTVKMVIIDEASMIDVNLFKNLLLALKDNTRVILVGDYNQLPSVGPGQILKDIIESDCFNVIKLNKLYRQKETSGIVELAHSINNNTYDFSIFERNNDLTFIECSNDNLKDKIIMLSNDYKIKNYEQFQLLAPIYKGSNGIDDLNNYLQDLFNKKASLKNEIIDNEVLYREKDKVLQLINMIDENVFNGDIGIIKSIDKNRKEMIVDFDNNLVSYTINNFKDLKLGYAISIHKSQGSEFDTVIIPILNKYNNMLYKKLIYTAITRAKKRLFIIGEKRALEQAINNNRENNRNTSLKNMIISSMNN